MQRSDKQAGRLGVLCAGVDTSKMDGRRRATSTQADPARQCLQFEACKRMRKASKTRMQTSYAWQNVPLILACRLYHGHVGGGGGHTMKATKPQLRPRRR